MDKRRTIKLAFMNIRLTANASEIVTRMSLRERIRKTSLRMINGPSGFKYLNAKLKYASYTIVNSGIIKQIVTMKSITCQEFRLYF